MYIKYGCVSDSFTKMLISDFLGGAILEYLTDRKDLNVSLNFWIYE